jgi:hypothetical protein
MLHRGSISRVVRGGRLGGAETAATELRSQRSRVI